MYRRRRIVALLILLAMLGAIAWGVSALLSGDEEPAADTSAPGAQVRVAGESRPADPEADGDDTTAAGSDGPAESEATAESGGTEEAQDVPAAPPEPGEVVACAADNLSLEASADPSSPAAGAPVTFELIVRNEGQMPCLLGAGPAELVVAVSSGNDSVWSSAHCADGANELLLDVEAHYTIPVRWNGQRSVEGCTGGGQPAAAGTYRAAVALDGATLPTPEPVVLDLR